MKPDLIVLGLGNPGPKYKNTRHNVGWWCMDELESRSSIKIGRGNRNTDVGEGYLAGIPVTLAKPQAFMNKSGDSAIYVSDRYNTDPSHLVVITDDMAIAPGKIRIRAQGGNGGHNGLKSINQRLGTQEFTRIRIGIGRPFDRADELEWVLKSFPPDDLTLIKAAVVRAADSVESILIDGLDRAMNKFN
jgi:PTH1 family peptidyl-tRNA hydrolase